MVTGTKAPEEWRKPLKAEFQKKRLLLDSKDTGGGSCSRAFGLWGKKRIVGASWAGDGSFSTLTANGSCIHHFLSFQKTHHIMSDGEHLALTQLIIGPLCLMYGSSQD